MLSTKPFDLDRFVRLLITLALILGSYYLLDKLSSVLVPFLVAWLTAYLLNPLVLWIQRWIKDRRLAVAITLSTIAGLTAVLFVLIVPTIVEEVHVVHKAISNQVRIMEWPDWLPQNMVLATQDLLATYDWKTILATEGMADKAALALTEVWNTLSGIFGFIWALLGIVSFILYLVFIMLDYEAISKEWPVLIPEKHKDWVFQLVQDIELGMNGYFKAQSKIVFSVMVMFALGFKFIGLPFAFGLGILVGLLNYIPYAQLLGLIPAIALAGLATLEQDVNFWWMLALVLIVFTVVQLIQDLWLTPKFLGQFSGFNPAIILLSLSVWGALLGTIGIIIAIPLTALLLAYYKRFVLKQEV